MIDTDVTKATTRRRSYLHGTITAQRSHPSAKLVESVTTAYATLKRMTSQIGPTYDSQWRKFRFRCQG